MVLKERRVLVHLCCDWTLGKKRNPVVQQVISASKKTRRASIYVNNRYDKSVQKIDSLLYDKKISFFHICATELCTRDNHILTNTHTKPLNNYIKLHKLSCLKLNTRAIVGSIAQDLRCEERDLIDNCGFTDRYFSVLPPKRSTNASFTKCLFWRALLAWCHAWLHASNVTQATFTWQRCSQKRKRSSLAFLKSFMYTRQCFQNDSHLHISVKTAKNAVLRRRGGEAMLENCRWTEASLLCISLA